MAEYPKYINILGIPFEIKFVKKVDKDDSMGECDSTSRVIKIKKDTNNEIIESTLLHEIIHGVLAISGVSSGLSEKKEEMLTVALENGLIQLYQRRIKETSSEQNNS